MNLYWKKTEGDTFEENVHCHKKVKISKEIKLLLLPVEKHIK
jgi:hypothetical protein